MGSLEILKKNIAEADMVLVGIGNENRDNGQRQKYEKLLENKNHYIIDEDMTEASEGWNLYSKWLMGTLNRKTKRKCRNPGMFRFSKCYCYKRMATANKYG